MRLFLSLVLTLGIAGFAQAHEPRKGPRGGALVDAESYHIEVLAQGGGLDVYLSDIADKPLPAASYKGLAILAIAGKTVRVPLEATADGAKLTGAAPAPLALPLKGAVQITAPDGKTATGKLN